MNTRWLTILALLGALTASATAQPAQPTPPAPVAPVGFVEAATPWRSGFMFGVGGGFGSLVADCDDCRDTMEAGGLNGHIGYLLRPRLALIFDVWGMVHRESFLTVYQNINTVGARWWPTRKLWLQLGVGNANAGYRWAGVFANFEDRTEKAPGFMLGVGYELHAKPTFAIDIGFRYGTGSYDTKVGSDYVIEGHSSQLGVGFNWF